MACDTPVYRYALYNWSTSPYVLYRFRDESPTASTHPASADRATDEGAAGAPTGPQTNFVEIVVGRKDQTQLDLVPEMVLQTWRERDQTVPLDVLWGPQGVVIFTGEAPVSETTNITDSPARREVVRQLGAGQPCVFIVLTGSDPAAKSAALAAVDEVIARGASGKIEPAKLGTDPSAAPSQPPAVTLGRVTVSADDPEEAWLVRMLSQVEPDLDEFAGQPMVFAIYGRGRAMEPYIGEGVTAENLSECVSFILGSCSCQVKDQNPGVDLLTNWDWETTALAVAQQVGQEEGNEALLDAADSRILSQVVAPSIASPPTASPPDGPAIGGSASAGAAPLAPASDDAPRVRVALQPRPLAAATPVESTEAAPPFASQVWLRIALALLLLVAVAAAGTMVLLRSRAPRPPARHVS